MENQTLDPLSTPNWPTKLAAPSVEDTQFDVADIQDWLAAQISEQIGMDADEVDITTPFSSYGLQSVQAMAIAELGKQRFGLEISPLVIWNYPTIASLSEHIDRELSDDDSELFEV